MLRSQVHAFKSSRIDNVDMAAVVASKEFDDMFDDAAKVDTFDLLLNSVDAGWPELCTKPFDAAWWEPLMHRCIIAFTFLAIRMSGAPSTEEEELEEEARNNRNSPFLRYTYSEVIKLLREEVARKHRAEAKEVESALAWFFSEDVINPSYDKRDQERMRKAVSSHPRISRTDLRLKRRHSLSSNVVVSLTSHVAKMSISISSLSSMSGLP